jgi:MoxR-like ATPase
MTAISYADLQLPVYLNSHSVGAVGGTDLTIVDAINAAQIMGRNVFLAGKKGMGKSQILRDIYRNRYGAKGVMQEGRPDLRVDEIYKAVNLQKLLSKQAVNTAELEELLGAVDWHFVGIDELNRAPEITQNQLLGMMNGEIIHKSTPYKLGKGFHAGIGTGNLGNGGYVGTFKIDDALADRLHLFLNLDYWKPKDEDMAVIDARTDINPRVVDAPIRDISNQVISAHNEILAQGVPLELTIIARYLERALNYCPKFPAAGNSKDNLGDNWPGICTHKSCERKDTFCSRIKAVGERAVKAVKGIAMGLQYVAKLKNPKTPDDPVGAGLLAARLILPYSGSISHNYLMSEGIFGNANIAAEKIVEDIKKEFDAQVVNGSKPGPLTMAILLPERKYEPASPEWNFVVPTLKEIRKAQSQGGAK